VPTEHQRLQTKGRISGADGGSEPVCAESVGAGQAWVRPEQPTQRACRKGLASATAVFRIIR
jgi:hypothetical protein